MKTEVMCGCMETVVYDSDHPETLHPNVVCKDCQEQSETNKRRLHLISNLADHTIEDRDLEQINRLVDHLFGTKVYPRLTAAGFYSLTPAKRKKIKRQMDDDFGPQIPEII
jgi:hypothetical protein